MDIKAQTGALKLLYELMDRSKNVSPILETGVQKQPFREAGGFKPLPRLRPEQAGLQSGKIEGYLRELFGNPRTFVHTVLIIRQGKVIAEAAAYPYRMDLWRATHSLCKSLTGLAIGILEGEGKLSLDDKAAALFEIGPLSLILPRIRSITVRDLLTMSSGVLFNEAGVVTEEDWQRAFFESVSAFEPGSRFNYNSMNSYMLGAIVRQISGESLTDFLKPRLLEPMGFGSLWWEKCPKGLEKGGMGLYLLPEDMAKLGLLYLQKGKWDGRQLVPESWFERALSPQIRTPEDLGGYDYGYQVWVRRDGGSFALNGMFGQNVLAFPQNGVLVAVTAGNNEMFQQNPFFEITERWFAKMVPDRPRSGVFAAHRLRKYTKKVSSPPAAPRGEADRILRSRIERLNGCTLVFEEGETNGVGLFPLIAQTIQNIHTGGLRRVTFALRDDQFWMSFEEREERCAFPVGMRGAAKSPASPFTARLMSLPLRESLPGVNTAR